MPICTVFEMKHNVLQLQEPDCFYAAVGMPANVLVALKNTFDKGAFFLSSVAHCRSQRTAVSFYY